MDPNFEWTTREEKLLVIDYWWEEQGKLCCICGEEMEPYKRQGTHNPKAATVEHLIPKRDNGPNTVGNIRLAHAFCNHTLGALWEQNRHRAKIGLAPLTEKEALSKSKSRKAKGLIAPPFNKNSWYPKESAYYLLWMKWKDEQDAKKLRGEAWKRVSLPRGATLLPGYERLIGKHLKTGTARKMTASETARWLAEQGVRGS